jgi:hypothetical protein
MLKRHSFTMSVFFNYDIRNNYLFSIDNNQTQYFVHSNQYKGDINWYKLKEGELLKVHPLPADPSQSAIKVKAAFSC